MKNMKKAKRLKWSQIAMTLVLVVLAASLVLPLIRGESPVDFGLDLSGGVIVSYRPDFSSRLDAYAGTTEGELLSLAKETLASRLYRKLNTIPEVVVRGDQRIVVSIPSAQDQHEVLELIGETYNLTFRLVIAKYPAPVAGKDLFPHRGEYLELAPAEFSGDMLDERYVKVEMPRTDTLDAAALEPKVAFRFRSPHDGAFAELTGANVGRELAILIDDQVEWAGTIESAIVGSGVLAGGYTLAEATDVAMMLKSGTLPVSLAVESLTAVGPSLGQEIRDLGIRALVLAVALLAALLAVAYLHRSAFLLAGLVSLACLLFLIAGLAAAFDLTLDMVGIAGIILSVGMGMDAFIIVFESLESRADHTAAGQLAAHRSRIARAAYSFTGEGRTLFHANATTFVVIALLLATERLKSFALFMVVGLLASVLTIFVTRAVLGRLHGLLPDLGRDPLAWLRRSRPGVFRLRKVYLAAVLAALAVTGLLLVQGVPGGPSLAFGDDFKAGTQLIVASPRPDSFKAALAELGDRLPDAGLRHQRLGDDGDGRYLVTVGKALHDLRDELGAGELARLFAAPSVELESMSSIDGKLSSRRLLRSLSVLVLSFFFLAVYFVALQEDVNRLFAPRGGGQSSPPRTRWLIFTGILLAVVTDLAVMLAFAAWLAIPVNLPAVAAVLTIVGYSVNDSVVLWSHVRQRHAELAGAAGSAVEVVARSVDGILSRAFLTSLSTTVPAWTILVVGLTPLADFARLMIAGTVAGTLSSLFVVGSFAVRALEREARPAERAAIRPHIAPNV